MQKILYSKDRIRNRTEEILKSLFFEIVNIGKNPEGFGVTRLGYEKEEDQIHEKFIEIGKEYGFLTEVDSVGNSIISNVEKSKTHYLTGSHLDSVIEGGSFDGVLGVLAGLSILILIKELNLEIPLRVMAFRCEESTNFSAATIGSKLLTKENAFEKLKTRESKFGKTLEEVFNERRHYQELYDFNNVINFIELHIEQGRVLEEENKTIGLVTDISGNIRFRVSVEGISEHSGATPMEIRRDALCGASEMILEIEKIGKDHSNNFSKTTVGMLVNQPNSLNVVPGSCIFDVDIRGTSFSDLENIRGKILESIYKISGKRDLSVEISDYANTNPVKLDVELLNDLENITKKLEVPYMKLPSGGGHDAMNFKDVTKTAMVFIPCEKGISHNPKENIDFKDASIGIDIMLNFYNKNYKKIMSND